MQGAALFNAARGVTRKHVALRSRQLQLYGQTSLGKLIRSQTERVTETVKAAGFLASRLNETAPAWTQENTPLDHSTYTAVPEHSATPSRKSTSQKEDNRTIFADGLAQDHCYGISPANSSIERSAHADLDIHQETANRHPLPDGTIPPAHSFADTEQKIEDVEQGEKASELDKQPWVKDNKKEVKHPNIVSHASTSTPSKRRNAEIPSPEDTGSLQQQFEQQIPRQPTLFCGGIDGLSSGHDQESFYERPTLSTPVSSALPFVKIPLQTDDAQRGNEHVQIGEINSDSYYSTQGPRVSALPQIPTEKSSAEQEEKYEGINTDLFYSPRVARILGGTTRNGKRPGPEPKTGQDTAISKTTFSNGADQHTFNVRTSDPAATILTDAIGKTTDGPNSVDQAVESLAESLADQTISPPRSDVSQALCKGAWIVLIADGESIVISRNDCGCYNLPNARV